MITDELRKWKSEHSVLMGGIREFDEMLDRIDAAHRAALEKLAAQVDESERIGFDQGFASADDWLAQHEDAMAEHGWIRLPVDADGVPIRVGDKIEYLSGGRDIVRFVTFNHGGWLVNERGWEPFTMRHYHAPTVEDVLREFAERYLDYEGIPSAGRRGVGEALMDEYAAKLQLREDA